MGNTVQFIYMYRIITTTVCNNVIVVFQHRTSFSKYNVNSCIDPPIFAAVPPTYRSSLIRPRQNSVFVGSSTNMLTSVSVNPPARKTKSAIDIQSLILSEARDSPPLSSKSMLLPLTMTATERRTSCLSLIHIYFSAPVFSKKQHDSLAPRPLLT